MLLEVPRMGAVYVLGKLGCRDQLLSHRSPRVVDEIIVRLPRQMSRTTQEKRAAMSTNNEGTKSSGIEEVQTRRRVRCIRLRTGAMSDEAELQALRRPASTTCHQNAEPNDAIIG
jgi:hypothetical protein